MLTLSRKTLLSTLYGALAVFQKNQEHVVPYIQVIYKYVPRLRHPQEVSGFTEFQRDDNYNSFRRLADNSTVMPAGKAAVSKCHQHEHIQYCTDALESSYSSRKLISRGHASKCSSTTLMLTHAFKHDVRIPVAEL